MSYEKTLFAAVIVLALTLNADFVYGDPEIIAHHNQVVFFLSLVVSLLATVLKFGERSLLGSTLLATSLVADVQLIGAAAAWGILGFDAEISPADSVTIVSLAMGALVANVVSVVLLVIETASLRR